MQICDYNQKKNTNVYSFQGTAAEDGVAAALGCLAAFQNPSQSVMKW